MTYCKHTGCGVVFGVLLRVERCRIEGKFLLHIVPVGPIEGFPRKFWGLILGKVSFWVDWGDGRIGNHTYQYSDVQ